MKKTFRFYSVAWVILLVLFNTIAFVSVGWTGMPKYTPSFWIGYVFISITFIGQIICAYFALRDNNIKKTFYNISLITTSYTGLILSFVFGGLCMLLSLLPYWVGIILCTILLACNALSVLKASSAIDIVSETEEKVKAKTLFIRSLTVDAESLLVYAKSDVVKDECKKVYESLRYSDPMSAPALVEIESKIESEFAALTEAVKTDNVAAAQEAAKRVVLFANDRNKKCKLMK